MNKDLIDNGIITYQIVYDNWVNSITQNIIDDWIEQIEQVEHEDNPFNFKLNTTMENL